MRRMLWGLAVGLLTFTSSAWAEGPIVRWDRIEGISPVPGSPWVIGDQENNKISSHPTRWTAGKGRAMVNLETGFVLFQVEGLVFSDTGTGNPIGSIGSRLTVIGTVVCNAGERPSPWVIEFADTAETALQYGDVVFSGYVAIPPMCLENPERIAFLIRRPSNVGMFPLSFIAFGADRTIQ